VLGSSHPISHYLNQQLEKHCNLKLVEVRTATTFVLLHHTKCPWYG
jgi:hypothetical protein